MDLSPLIKNYSLEFSLCKEEGKNLTTNNSHIKNYFSVNGGIVRIYNTATLLIGQSTLENGKTMGLYSYGEKIKDCLL